MGIGSILAAAARHVSWGQVATVAWQYGPEILKKIKDRRQPEPVVDDQAAAVIEQLHGRVEELEGALLEQQQLIVRQNDTIGHLQEVALTLQSRAKIFMFIAIGASLLSLMLLILLIRA